MNRRTRSQTANQLQRTRSQTEAHHAARGQKATSKTVAQRQQPAQAQPAATAIDPPAEKKNKKKRKEAPASILAILQKAKAAKGTGVRIFNNRIDTYKETARWNCRAIGPFVSHIGVFYAGLDEKLELDDDDIAHVPDDDEERAECLKHFDAYSRAIGEEQLFDDLERLLEANMIDDLATLSNTCFNDARTQDTRDLRVPALDYFLAFMGWDSFTPAIAGNAPKDEARGLKHLQIARMMIPAEHVEEFDKDPQAFLNKVENGEVEYTEQQLGLYLYENGVYDKDDVSKGLCKASYIVQVWKHLFLSPAAAAVHGKKRKPGDKLGNSGKAGDHGMTKVTKESIGYAIIQGYRAISHSKDWRIGQNAVDGLALWNVFMAACENQYFERELLRWWNNEGLNGSLLKKTRQKGPTKQLEIQPNSTLGMLLQQGKVMDVQASAAALVAQVAARCLMEAGHDNVVPAGQARVIAEDMEHDRREGTNPVGLDSGAIKDLFADTQPIAGSSSSKAPSPANDATQPAEDSCTEEDEEWENLVKAKGKAAARSKSYRRSTATQIINSDEEEVVVRPRRR
ncbi:hypothetical protein V5O48_015501 [Marasmius crinis-equi]|uniref:Uncharacterized protein n=1 Tax=Marasmius crinis-equi TaxID=585013 RepID=A0ABR3EUC3_9AGAR